MRFLGTGALEAIPDPLCNCYLCQIARKDPGEQRCRSMFQLDKENLIDCGPDFYSVSTRFKLELNDLQNVFVTHTHEDHLSFTNANFIRNSITRACGPVNLYLSQAGYDYLYDAYSTFKDKYTRREGIRALERGLVELHVVKPGHIFNAGGYIIMPVNTCHKASPTETALNYRFEKSGKSLLYACDTGWYLEESLDILRGSNLSVLIMEGTWGNNWELPIEQHLSAKAFLTQLETFSKYGIISSDTRIFVTHISHKHTLTQAEYQNYMNEHTDRNVTVAYDGLEIDL